MSFENQIKEILKARLEGTATEEELAILRAWLDRSPQNRELAELLVRYRAKIYMPFHMDVIYKRWGKEKTEEYFKEVGRFVRELSAGSEFLFPEPWKWYRLGTAVEEEA